MKNKLFYFLIILLNLFVTLSLHAKTINAGPIWNQKDAESKCPLVCTNNAREWTGEWWTTETGKMSVCACKRIQHKKKITINAGPIWNQSDAEAKCPPLCKDKQRNWSGNWSTTEPGKMSVCECN